jgi:hypothetical protein
VNREGGFTSKCCAAANERPATELRLSPIGDRMSTATTDAISDLLLRILLNKC